MSKDEARMIKGLGWIVGVLLLGLSTVVWAGWDNLNGDVKGHTVELHRHTAELTKHTLQLDHHGKQLDEVGKTLKLILEELRKR